jgi:hypothetical protein
MAVWPYVNHKTILAITILPDHMVYVWPYGVWLESLLEVYLIQQFGEFSELLDLRRQNQYAS